MATPQSERPYAGASIDDTLYPVISLDQCKEIYETEDLSAIMVPVIPRKTMLADPRDAVPPVELFVDNDKFRNIKFW